MRLTCAVVLLILHVVIGELTLFPQIVEISEEQGIPIQQNDINDNFPKRDEYDFIVVGSGPAGSAIANRLSEITSWNILLLEAGEEGTIINEIPAYNEYTILTSTTINYDVEKEPQVCLGLVDKRCHWSSGNGVGGATIHNAMMHTRGHPKDYDRWAREGSPGWSYNEVFPYFLKYENMSIPGLAESPYHSTKGPVHIQYSFLTEIGRRFLVAGQELGYDLIDYNNPNTMIGFAQTQTTTKGVKRFSAKEAYLLPILNRPNVEIVKNAIVTKLIARCIPKRVYGVTFIKNNVKRKVFVKKEVILSAGAFGSPKILMLSGIGPEKHLSYFGIPILKNLPVGNNLQEHLGTPTVTFLINTTDSMTLPKQLITIGNDYLQWLNGINGSLANNLGEAIGYVKTKYANQIADVELIVIPTTMAADGGLFLKRTRNISDEVFEKTWKPIFYQEGFTILPMMLYPKSRGTVRLRSSNPEDPIVIRSNFLKHPSDIRTIIEGVRAAIRVGQTRIFQEIGAQLYTNPVYGCETYQFDSDEYWECAIRTITFLYHHQSGTCRMGSDPSVSVVDPRLRVHCVPGLRVADASIIPTIPGVHSMAACYMIGEKAADLIKEDWGVLQ